jgi:nucleoside-diphosphate-sugar epimerase
MRVLVTGANGFVGSALCRALLQRGDLVRGLVRTTSDLSLLHGLPIEQVQGDLDDPPSLITATRDVDIVYHVAAAVSDWGSLSYFRRVNVEGTRHVLDAMGLNSVKRLVYVSSAAVHSFIDAQNMDEHSPQLPTSYPYCQTKREAEALVMQRYREGRIAATVVRPGDLYGPGDRVVLLKLDKLLHMGALPYVAGGYKLGAFTYVENLADGLILAGSSQRAIGEAYIITDGVKTTWREYFVGLTRALGYPEPRLSVSPVLACGVASTLESVYCALGVCARPPITRYLATHMSNDFHFTIAKAGKQIGYQPRVGMDEALARTATWLHNTKKGQARS